MLYTQGIYNLTYGKVEARMMLPQGEGMWPAFWMLGDDIDSKGWPECGEIDIMEYIGKTPNNIYGSLHGPGYDFSVSETCVSLSNDYHVYGVEWNEEQISWYFDDVTYSVVTRAEVGNNEWVFDKGFYILLNLAVGGNWPGPPDNSTVFPQMFYIDYVRVYQQLPGVVYDIEDSFDNISV